MKIFISWSGDKSRETAEVLGSWIRQVIQSAEPWVSPEMEKGVRWNEALTRELEKTRFGILCLNNENPNAPWLVFEAGALSKTKDAYVCTFLLDILPKDIQLPLGQFQHTSFRKEDVRKLILTINRRVMDLKEKGLSEQDLSIVFETFWPRLEAKIREIQARHNAVGEKAKGERLHSEESIEKSEVKDLVAGRLLDADVLTLDLESIRSSKLHYKINEVAAIAIILNMKKAASNNSDQQKKPSKDLG